ncbi:MAG: choice-of-anchor D domain-containing protein, partial [Ignavibacteria bacterium]
PGITIVTPLPIQLKPGETMMVNVRIEPPTDGAYKGVISFLSNECGFKKDIVIETTKESASYTLSKSIHQFMSLIRCDAQYKLKDSILIKASALGISGDATISNIDITGPFSASIKSGDILTGGSKDFMITFAPMQDGVFTGKLTLTFEPCSIVRTIDLSGSLSSSTITVPQTAIAFPLTDSGMVEQRTFTFTNSGQENIRMRSIGGFIAPFSYTANKNIGENIAPGETVTFTVSYTPIGNSTDSMIAIVEIEGPCPQQIKVAISGIGNLPKPTDVNGLAELIGDSQSAKPGATVTFPIRITSQNLAEMNLASMSFNIAYNRSLLLPKALRLKQSQLMGMMSESSPGILTFTINANDTNSKILAGNLLEFECMALLGDAMSTPLTIQNQTFVKRTPGTCTLTTNTPTFTLEDVCDLPNRLIRPNGTLSLAKINQSLRIEVFSQDRTILDIHTMDGSLISRMVDGSLTSGVHEFALPFDMPSGIYVAILKSGHFTRILSFDHVK